MDSFDDAIHSDNSITITGGNIDITKSYEGMESNPITILDGKIHITATDDGINISAGDDNSDTSTEQTEKLLLSIDGGYVYIDAAGDGLDSNGSISMTDGTVIVNGSTNNG